MPGAVPRYYSIQDHSTTAPTPQMCQAQIYNSELEGFYNYFQYEIDMFTLLFTHYHYLGTLGFKEVSKMYLVNI